MDPLEPGHPIDNQMICDINSIANRLVSKAEHHDGEANALDVSPDLRVSDLNELTASYYLTHVKVIESAATKIMIDTSGQGDDNSENTLV